MCGVFECARDTHTFIVRSSRETRPRARWGHFCAPSASICLIMEFQFLVPAHWRIFIHFIFIVCACMCVFKNMHLCIRINTYTYMYKFHIYLVYTVYICVRYADKVNFFYYTQIFVFLLTIFLIVFFFNKYRII